MLSLQQRVSLILPGLRKIVYDQVYEERVPVFTLEQVNAITHTLCGFTMKLYKTGAGSTIFEHSIDFDKVLLEDKMTYSARLKHALGNKLYALAKKLWV